MKFLAIFFYRKDRSKRAGFREARRVDFLRDKWPRSEIQLGACLPNHPRLQNYSRPQTTAVRIATILSDHAF